MSKSVREKKERELFGAMYKRLSPVLLTPSKGQTDKLDELEGSRHGLELQSALATATPAGNLRYPRKNAGRTACAITELRGDAAGRTHQSPPIVSLVDGSPGPIHVLITSFHDAKIAVSQTLAVVDHVFFDRLFLGPGLPQMHPRKRAVTARERLVLGWRIVSHLTVMSHNPVSHSGCE